MWNHFWATFIDIWRFLSGHTVGEPLFTKEEINYFCSENYLITTKVGSNAELYSNFDCWSRRWAGWSLNHHHHGPIHDCCLLSFDRLFKKISKVSFLSWRPFLVCRWKRQKKFFFIFWAHSNKLNQKNRGRENRIKKSKKIISKQKPEVALNWVVMRLNSLFSSSSHVMVTKYDFCRVTIAKVRRYFKIVFGPFSASFFPFSASFSLYFVVTVRLTVNKNRRWLDLNRGSLWSNCSSNCATTTAHNEYNF